MRYKAAVAITLATTFTACGSDNASDNNDALAPEVCLPESMEPQDCTVEGLPDTLSEPEHFDILCASPCTRANVIRISRAEVTDLRALARLEAIFDLTIENNANLKSLKGIENLKTVAALRIYENPQLQSLEGLESLTEIGQDATWGDQNQFSGYVGQVVIEDNPLLNNLKGLDNVERIGRDGIAIRRNEQLRSLEGLESLKESGKFTLESNQSLSHIDEISSLEQVDAFVVFRNNNLISLQGASSLKHSDTYFEVSENNSLPACEAIRLSQQLETAPNERIIRDNNGEGSCD